MYFRAYDLSRVSLAPQCVLRRQDVRSGSCFFRNKHDEGGRRKDTRSRSFAFSAKYSSYFFIIQKFAAADRTVGTSNSALSSTENVRTQYKERSIDSGDSGFLPHSGAIRSFRSFLIAITLYLIKRARTCERHVAQFPDINIDISEISLVSSSL